MLFKKIGFAIFLCGITLSVCAQDHNTEKNTLENTFSFKQMVNDSVYFQLVRYGYAKKIDSLWQARVESSNLFSNMQNMVLAADEPSTHSAKLSTSLLKKRLKIIDATTPLKVIYQPVVEDVIQRYMRWKKSDMEKLMQLADYYFPMFENHLAKYNIPLEIKYLAVVESALKPRAKSWAGAAGLWQFMFSTGKMYGLGVSSYVDDRMDPILATEAACKYLSNLYGIFEDWNLALAAYNAGPGNVSQAIRRSGGQKDYWAIRPYLPRETAGYVPAFFASIYIFKYAKAHGYSPKIPEVPFYQTDTIHIRKMLTFKDISEVLQIDTDLLEFLNPSYKLNIIPYISDKNYYLRLPISKIGLFTANEKKIYTYVEQQIAKREKPLPRYLEADDKIIYRVKSGDYLGKIAEKYGVGVRQIKKWNHLRSTRLRIGQRLSIYPKKPVSAVIDKAAKEYRKSKKIYIVQSGDSLWSIANKFNEISVENIKNWNGISGSMLKPGMKLKLSSPE